ncbi:MAG: SDR family oxidoreductase [Pseudomonadota bacterium]
MPENTKFKGAALVTGAGARLGKAMAEALGAAGYDVAVHYNKSAGPAEETAAAVRKAGRKAEIVQADLSKEEEVADLVAKAGKAVGPLTILINNASTFEDDRIETMTRDSWDLHMEANLRAPVKLIQDFAAALPAEAKGSVVNMIDQRVWKLTPHFVSYMASKSALWTLTRTLAQGLAPRIRVNAIGPGPTLRNVRQTAEDFEKQQKATLLERGSNPQEICRALLYLLDADVVTGQMIAVDGGQHLVWQTPDVYGLTE